jgi:hypothetical protein
MMSHSVQFGFRDINPIHSEFKLCLHTALITGKRDSSLNAAGEFLSHNLIPATTTLHHAGEIHAAPQRHENSVTFTG